MRKVVHRRLRVDCVEGLRAARPSRFPESVSNILSMSSFVVCGSATGLMAHS